MSTTVITVIPPLHNAIKDRDWSGAKAIVGHGAAINAKDNEGKTPLHWAARWRDMDTVNILLKHGADINAKDNDGNTPIAIAKVGVTRELKI